MSKLPILYSFVRCPYAIRARLALVQAGINCVLREVDLKNKPAALLGISPKGTVPVLVIDDKTIIDESLDIVYYALGKNISNQEKQEFGKIIYDNDTEFVKLLRVCKYPDKYPDLCPNSCKDEIEEKFLKKYESMLDGKIFFSGEEKSILDIAIMSFIRQFSIVYPEWFFNSKYKNLISWLKRFIDDSDFKNIIMKKNQPWTPGDETIYLF